MTTEEKIEVIKAYDEGKEVEVYEDYCGKWCKKDDDNCWDFDIYEYRVKPQPTRLDVANEFWEKTFGLKNVLDESSCIQMDSRIPCCKCVAYKEGRCVAEIWWNTPFEKNIK